jgi:hypothetical protein
MKKFFAGLLAIVCCLSSFGCFGLGDKSNDLTVYMPDGAPALAFAKLMHEDTEDDGFEYKVVSPTVIKTKVTYKDDSKNADLCVLPLTAATKLLGSGESYQMLATVTHGNLYLISKDDSVSYTAENIHSLKGKTVGVLQLNEVPGLVLKTVLSKLGVAYQENGESVADKVNLIPITGAQDVGALTGVDLYLLAEPAVSAQATKGFKIVGDLQTLYGGENGYPQAVLVIKKSVIAKDWGRVYAWLEKLETAHEWLTSATATEIVTAVTAHLEDTTYASSLKAPLLTGAVLSRCGVWYQYSTAAMPEVKAFITAAQVVNENMATMPKDEFFYQK